MLNVGQRQASFNIQHSTFNIDLEPSRSKFSLLPSAFPPAHPSGGEWGLVAPAVFKTVVSARKRRKVGSIPTRLRHIGGQGSAFGGQDHHPPSGLGRAGPDRRPLTADRSLRRNEMDIDRYRVKPGS